MKGQGHHQGLQGCRNSRFNTGSRGSRGRGRERGKARVHGRRARGRVRWRGRGVICVIGGNRVN